MKVKEIRTTMGLSQTELAQQAGLSKGFVSLFERGLRGISLEQLSSLSAALNLPPSVLIVLAEDADSLVGWRRDLMESMQHLIKLAVRLDLE